MGQGLSSSENFFSYSSIDERARPLTFSDDIGPIARARAMVAQVQTGEPLAQLLTQFYIGLAESLEESDQDIAGDVQKRNTHFQIVRNNFPVDLIPSEQSPTANPNAKSYTKIKAMANAISSKRKNAQFLESLKRGDFYDNGVDNLPTNTEKNSPETESTAEEEYNWLVQFIDRLYSSSRLKKGIIVSQINSAKLVDVFVAGVAIWLQFWRNWGGNMTESKSCKEASEIIFGPFKQPSKPPKPLKSGPEMKKEGFKRAVKILDRLLSHGSSGDENFNISDDEETIDKMEILIPTPKKVVKFKLSQSQETGQADAIKQNGEGSEVATPEKRIEFQGSTLEKTPEVHRKDDGNETSEGSWSNGIVKAFARALSFGEWKEGEENGLRGREKQGDKGEMGKERNTLEWMIQMGDRGTLQEFLVRELLVNEGQPESVAGLAEVVRVVGLAASLSESRPTFSCLSLVKLLARLRGEYGGTWVENEGGLGENGGEIMGEREQARKFVLWSLLDVLEGCGSVGGISAVGGLSSRIPSDSGSGFEGVFGSEGSYNDEFDEEFGEDIMGPFPGEHRVSRVQDGAFHLSEIVEIAIADWITGDNGARTSAGRNAWEVCRDADLAFGLEIGPGVTAVILSTFLGTFPPLPPEATELASRLEGMGCREAAFRARTSALAAPRLADFIHDVIADVGVVSEEAMVFRGAESVPRRLRRFLGMAVAAKAKLQSVEDRNDLARAISAPFLAQLGSEAVESRRGNERGVVVKHPWRKEIAQAYFQLNGTGTDWGEDERLCARVLIEEMEGKWVGKSTSKVEDTAEREENGDNAEEKTDEEVRVEDEKSVEANATESRAMDDVETKKQGDSKEADRKPSVSPVGKSKNLDNLNGSERGKLWRFTEWVEVVEDVKGEVGGWASWFAMGKYLEEGGDWGDEEDYIQLENQRDQRLRCLKLMWAKAVNGTYRTINQEGTGVDKDALAAFDWGLESILILMYKNVVGDSSPVPALIEILTPKNSRNPKKITHILLAIAARLSCTIYWKWPKRKEVSQMIARLLKHVHDNNGLDGGDFRWAVAIAMRHWSWAMPSLDSLKAEHENAAEVQAIVDQAMIATWDSFAAAWEEDESAKKAGDFRISKSA